MNLKTAWFSATLAALAATAATDATAGKILFEDGSDCYHVSPNFKENNRATVTYFVNVAKLQGPITIGRFNRFELGRPRRLDNWRAWRAPIR